MDLTALFFNFEPPGLGTDSTGDRFVDEPSEPVAKNVHKPGRALPRLDEEAVTSLVAAYLSGTPIRELAINFDINVTTVHSHLKRRGIELRPFRKVKPEQVAEAVALHESGSSIFTIAKRLGVSWNTAQRIVTEGALGSPQV